MLQKLPSIVIGGGTGFIGSILKAVLEKKGYKIITVSRVPGVNHITWTDIKEKGLPEKTHAVVNLTGQNVLDPTQRWTTGFKLDVINSRVESTKRLREAIDEAEIKPKAFISMSGVGIYKPNSNVTYDEYSDTGKGFDFISNLAHDWEEVAKLDSPDVRQITIRSGVVLGRTGGMIRQIYFPFYLGLGGRIGDGNQHFPWIHIHDICRLILFSVENSNVKGVLNGVAPQIITNNDFTKAFARTLWRPAIFPLPAFAVKLIFGEERSVMMLEGQKVVPKKVLEYGFQYSYPEIDKACREFSNLTYAPPSY